MVNSDQKGGVYNQAYMGAIKDTWNALFLKLVVITYVFIFINNV